MKAADAADAIWTELKRVPKGLDLAELVKATGLTRCQVGNGLRKINHELQETYGQPMAVDRIFTGKRGRPRHAYVLPDVWKDQRPWSKERLADLLRRTRTESVRARASQSRWPGEVPAFLSHTLERLEIDIKFALEMLGPSGTP